MVGLMTSDELVEVDHRKQSPSTPISKARPSSGQYSRQTGRWNETPKTSQRARSARRRTPLSSSPTRVFCVDEHEREIWVRRNVQTLKSLDNLLFFRSFEQNLSRCCKFSVKFYKQIASMRFNLGWFPQGLRVRSSFIVLFSYHSEIISHEYFQFSLESK